MMTTTAVRSDVSEAPPLRLVEDPPTLPHIEGGFKTILADPPWRFTNRTGKIAPEHRRLDRYSTLDFKQICDLDVASIAAPTSHLYLWVPNAMLPDGLKVMEEWGFRYISNIIWAKRRKDGGPDGRGVGFYFRNVTEILLFGVRGKMRTLPPARSQVNMIESRKREHSRKPDEQYDLIESCSPGPYLELFSRHPQEDWTGWGDEADEEVVPRGKAQRGYQGGLVNVPYIDAYVRLPQEARLRVAAALKERYEAGASISQLSRETGYSIARVRGLLAAVDTQIRTRGRKSVAQATRLA